jgi:hypothetical protein
MKKYSKKIIVGGNKSCFICELRLRRGDAEFNYMLIVLNCQYGRPLMRQ